MGPSRAATLNSTFYTEARVLRVSTFQTEFRLVIYFRPNDKIEGKAKPSVE